VILINLGELYCILRRKMSAAEVRSLLDQLVALPVVIVPVTEELVWAAAEIKRTNRLSYADSFAAAVAKIEGAAVLTGDAEFKTVEGMVEIEWIWCLLAYSPFRRPRTRQQGSKDQNPINSRTPSTQHLTPGLPFVILTSPFPCADFPGNFTKQLRII